MCARAIDSYREVLIPLLEAFRPSRVFEWGPGVSTGLLANFADTVDTVEHSREWYEKYKADSPKNVSVYFEPSPEIYPYISGRFEKYDLIFVDGRDREHCLLEAKKKLAPDGIVVLHDAERAQYQDSVNSYNYKFFYDQGNTCIMTDNDETARRIQEVLNDFS